MPVAHRSRAVALPALYRLASAS
ncbi:hypothetical protein FRAAL0041 [Frankia alni ACN14a]|uniref:Uncharacterized protein n=1 Tax=Frankia alni (strain DSM 45986 / CECT 9034 / ACN14a) TaxID=326424 RepID=Q0RUL5_FRAAA|nr:hypothetical protein FRAAL0041 [Frankia alni ACN14a]